ncbi:DUF4153 domain-containing protein [Hymenobacter sp. ASUV-10]|uniref:DUF4153 domain-containing protein n=1 Tax=Hymenobacter aranciens TaxID=3063996 RepID=A0ABT9B9R4_9BACT|nr:DUF4153 domain-containing protein [Hymenobacter sp. ASUV-10]MDO7874403.1 DUF4153 domain-containing protein [Hymenobacter sp. ASUV-10]
MHLPSLTHALAQAGQVARRFPLTLLCAVTLCVAGCAAIHFTNEEAAQAGWVFPLGSAAALGLPLTLALALAAERYGWRRATTWAAQGAAVAALAGWAALAPALPGLVWGLRLVVLLLGLHLAVAAAPYVGELRREADTPGFWRYNETLLLRLLLAGLYSGVLYAGCALALVAVRELFGWYTDGDWFGYLFVGLASLFNTWFFLAGVPRDWAALEQEAPYPRGLKVFTQFVLLPLVVLYVVILYAYMLRIVVQWELPEGWVSVLILALAVAGIFALLLIHPLRHDPANAWIRTFARWFYRALFPLLGLLALAIGTRIRAYGITEERYFVVLLAAWLLGIAAYFLWRQGRGIVWIPVTLAGLAFAAAAGPWGAFATAERSQLRQLRELVEQYQLGPGGRLDGAAAQVPTLPLAVRGRLSSLFDFFSKRDALAALQPQFAGSLALPAGLRDRSPWEQDQWRQDRPFELSGFEHFEPYQLQANGAGGAASTWVGFYVQDPPRYYSLGGGRYWLKDVGSGAVAPDPAGDVVLALSTADGSFRLLSTFAGDTLLLQRFQPDAAWRTALRLSLRVPADSLVARYGRNHVNTVKLATPVVVSAGAGPLRLRLFITSLNREELDHKARYTYTADGLLELNP